MALVGLLFGEDITQIRKDDETRRGGGVDCKGESMDKVDGEAVEERRG